MQNLIKTNLKSNLKLTKNTEMKKSDQLFSLDVQTNPITGE